MTKNGCTQRVSYRKIARALEHGDDLDVTYAVLRKIAKNLDDCESSRDIKPLVSCLYETMDRARALEAKDSTAAKVTPLSEVLRRAESA